ncbi:3-methyl-2-oxobutanoate dehydrogenase [lipoamide] kinase, mitochondrial-like isoform X1 [Dendronephthya gigantea]|uniref:3-methyl-2-oxobutanoate dehydrogenase [lipoamide] kinase, mitochondrial-like isoform X1 n=1 Tax=Dendronephthya gigantea TaxID=151771 RepID=UPI00106D4864|nr:3-methyl-2-oxobutanoate dehydrogenase [lipoamide] kinase, mitochondrial-like isoform X1 [Dendronephthya gigantea]
MKSLPRLARLAGDPRRRGISSAVKLHSERRYKNQEWSYVNQAAIENCAAKPSIKMTPYQMLHAGKFGDGAHLIRNVQFLQNELVIRVARRLVAFHSLPYIVAVNPDISETYELYIRAFNLLYSIPKIKDLQAEKKYSKTVRSLLDDHGHVVTSLARGFKGCKHQVRYGTIHSFLDKTLKSRLGMRLLAEHHIALREEKSNFVGCIATNLHLKTMIERCADFVKQVCEHHYGVSPNIVVNGHTDTSFSYFPSPLEYILLELLKNAMRSTVEFHGDKYTFQSSSLPRVEITICCNETDFTIRISDRGGGISDEMMEQIFHYSFTTFKKDAAGSSTNVLSDYNHNANLSGTIGSMAGFGFGLPTSRAYAEFLGGAVNLQTLHGYGTDVYIKLKRIDGDQDSFRL